MIDDEHNFSQSLSVFIDLLILYPLPVYAVILILVEFVVSLVGIPIVIHPSAVQVGEAS